MASQATQRASTPSTSGPRTRVEDDCIENIPSSNVASAAFVSKVFQVGDVPDCHVGTMSETLNISRETSTTAPSVHSGNSGERGANLGSTLTPIFKYLRLGLNQQRSHPQKPLSTGEDGSDDDPNVSSLFQVVVTEGCHKVIDSLRLFVERPIMDETLPNCSGISVFDNDTPSMSISFDYDSLPVVAGPAANTTVDLPCVPLETPGLSRLEEEITNKQNNTFDAQSSKVLSGTSTEVCGEKVILQNNTFDAQSSMKLNDTTEARGETVSVQNNTFDAQSSMRPSGISTDGGSEQVILQHNTFDAQSSMKLNSTTTEASGESVSVQNNTFDAQSSMKLKGTTQARGEAVNVQNNTFDAQSSMKLNGASTEVSSEKVIHQNNTFDAQSSMKPNGTIVANDGIVSSQNNTVDAQPTMKLNGTIDANGETVSIQKSTVDAQLSMALSDTSPEASGEAVSLQKNDEAPTFNLNNTLELGSSITSTPMPRSKVFNFKVELESGKTSDARKSLSACVLPKQTPQLPVPPKATTQLPGVSNLVGERRTFSQLPAPSSSSRPPRPSLRPPAQRPPWAGPPKTKPAAAVSGPSEPPVSALTSIKRTTRTEASKNAAASVSQEGPAILTVSNGRCSAIPESKLPCSGLRKPQPSGLKPPTRRAPASSNDKPSGSAATVRSKTKMQAASQTPKRLSTSTEALPVPKRKKLEQAGVKQLAGALTLRLPAKAVLQTANHPDECANCRALQQQLEKYRQENERLKEELQNL